MLDKNIVVTLAQILIAAVVILLSGIVIGSFCETEAISNKCDVGKYFDGIGDGYYCNKVGRELAGQ